MEEEFKFPSNWGLPEKWSIWPLNMQFAAWPCPAFILLFLCEQSVNRNMWSLIVILQVPNITQWTFWILTKQNSLNFDLISDFLSGYYKHWQTTMTDWRTDCNLHMSIFYLLFRKHQTLHLRKVKISFWSETFSLKRSEPFPTYKWHLLSNSSEPPCSTIFLSDIMTRQVFVSPDLVPGVRLGILWASRQSDVSSLSYFEWFICSPGLTLWEILFILPTNSLSGEQDELSYFNKNAIPVCNTISSPPSPTTVTSLLTMWKCHWCN